jgi:hypothetical protein
VSEAKQLNLINLFCVTYSRDSVVCTFEPFSGDRPEKKHSSLSTTFLISIYIELCAKQMQKFSSFCRVWDIFSTVPSASSNLMTHEKRNSKTHESHSRYSSCFSFFGFWQDPIFYELIRIFFGSSSSNPKQYVPFRGVCACVGKAKTRRWKTNERQKGKRPNQKKHDWSFMSCAIKRNRHDLNSLLLYNFRLFIFRLKLINFAWDGTCDLWGLKEIYVS